MSWLCLRFWFAVRSGGVDTDTVLLFRYGLLGERLGELLIYALYVVGMTNDGRRLTERERRRNVIQERVYIVLLFVVSVS